MKGWLTQRLANNFPFWTRLRQDPSSVGQRMLSVWANYYEQALVEDIKLLAVDDVLGQDLGQGQLFQVPLLEEDYVVFEEQPDGSSGFVYPDVVTGDIDSSTITLVRAEFFENFFTALPNTLTEDDTHNVTSWLLWTSAAPGTPASIEEPDHLTISVQGSTLYDLEDEIPGYHGTAYVYLEGEDLNGVEITEVIRITDDGVFKTNDIFSALTEQPVFIGFDGTLEVYLGSRLISLDRKDPYRAAVTPEREGPALYKLVDFGGTNYLQTAQRFVVQGKSYRRPTIELALQDFEDELSWQQMLDTTETPYQPISFDISPYDGSLWVLDNAGGIHVHDIGLTQFEIPPEEATFEHYVQVIPLRHRARFGEELPMWTWFRILRAPIKKVRIRRIDPSGNTEYLNDSGLWVGSSFDFFGDNTARRPEESWTDFKFTNTFDELGQWNFYCEVELQGVTDIYISHTAVYVESNTSKKDIPGPLPGAEDMFFDKDGLLALTLPGSYTKYDPAPDTYFVDTDYQTLYFRRPYSNVTVTYV